MPPIWPLQNRDEPEAEDTPDAPSVEEAAPPPMGTDMPRIPSDPEPIRRKASEVDG